MLIFDQVHGKMKKKVVDQEVQQKQKEDGTATVEIEQFEVDSEESEEEGYEWLSFI